MTYRFRARAVNEIGAGAWSDPADFTTETDPNRVPAADAGPDVTGVVQGASVTLDGHWLAAHGGSLDERGIGGVVRFEPEASGRGLSASLLPGWGAAESDAAGNLWEGGVTDLSGSDDGHAPGRLDAGLGHRFGALGGRGTLTSYGAFPVVGDNGRGYRLGLRFDMASSLAVSLGSGAA